MTERKILIIRKLKEFMQIHNITIDFIDGDRGKAMMLVVDGSDVACATSPCVLDHKKLDSVLRNLEVKKDNVLDI